MLWFSSNCVRQHAIFVQINIYVYQKPHMWPVNTIFKNTMIKWSNEKGQSKFYIVIMDLISRFEPNKRNCQEYENKSVKTKKVHGSRSNFLNFYKNSMAYQKGTQFDRKRQCIIARISPSIIALIWHNGEEFGEKRMINVCTSLRIIKSDLISLYFFEPNQCNLITKFLKLINFMENRRPGSFVEPLIQICFVFAW